jgi:hypothetical protein
MRNRIQASAVTTREGSVERTVTLVFRGPVSFRDENLPEPEAVTKVALRVFFLHPA